MDDKERLEEIKGKKFKDWTLEDRMFLVEQAEQYQKAHDTIIKLGKKVERLQGENIGLSERVRELELIVDKYFPDCAADVVRLENQNKRYREALEYYEKGRFGGVARKALEGEE